MKRNKVDAEAASPELTKEYLEELSRQEDELIKEFVEAGADDLDWVAHYGEANVDDCVKGIREYAMAKAALRRLGVIRSERITGEIGEWIVSQLFDASHVSSTSAKNVDLLKGEHQIQVKTHAKSKSNNARWTEYRYEKGAFDELIIIVLSEDLFLQEIYVIPEQAAYDLVDRNKKQLILKWDDASAYRQDLDSLRKQDLVKRLRQD